MRQCRDKVKYNLRDTPEFCAEIESKVREGIKELISARKPLTRKDVTPVPAAEPVTKEKARAKIDIAVDDDE